MFGASVRGPARRRVSCCSLLLRISPPTPPPSAEMMFERIVESRVLGSHPQAAHHKGRPRRRQPPSKDSGQERLRHRAPTQERGTRPLRMLLRARRAPPFTRLSSKCSACHDLRHRLHSGESHMLAPAARSDAAGKFGPVEPLSVTTQGSDADLCEESKPSSCSLASPTPAPTPRAAQRRHTATSQHPESERSSPTSSFEACYLHTSGSRHLRL